MAAVIFTAMAASDPRAVSPVLEVFRLWPPLVTGVLCLVSASPELSALPVGG